jgi:ribosome-interacting GTPase 1
MSTNADFEYGLAEKKYLEAKTNEEKLEALKKMLSAAPNHKASQVLRAEIKNRIAKLRAIMDKEKQQKKSTQLSIKKEGAAQIVIVGTTNSGKSTLLKKLTNAKVEIAPYEFTTKEPQIGILDYKGIKLQVVEIPAIVPNFKDTEKGPFLLSLIKQTDLVILLFNNIEEKKMLDHELIDIDKPILIYNNQEKIQDEIWSRLDIIKVYTKQPGHKPAYPPIAMKKGSLIEDLAEHIHKDFIKKFKFARIWGKSAAFPGQQLGLKHKLEDDDIVELHLK